MIISDELLLSAAGIVEKGCKERECKECAIQCFDYFASQTKMPDGWGVLRRQQKNKGDIENTMRFPFLIGNTVVYIKNGEPTMLTCGDKKQAEEAMKEITEKYR